jgi:hypothetical protein
LTGSNQQSAVSNETARIAGIVPARVTHGTRGMHGKLRQVA